MQWKWLLLLALVSLPRTAAAEIICALTEPDVIVVDGFLDDWKGVAGDRWAGDSAKDASFTVRCNYDPDTLYLSIDVADDQLIRRGKKDKGAEDTLVLAFGDKRLEISPSDSEHSIARRARGAAKGVEIADSLQPRGWSIEVALPRKRVPGWGKGVTSIPFGVQLRDADLFSEKAHQEEIGALGGALTLEEGASLYKQFLEDNHLKPKDIWLDQMANMDGEPGMERVVVGGRLVGVLGDQYYFMQLPVPKKDLLSLKVLDLAGEGKSAILVHYVERGNGGSREVLAVWTLLPDGSWARPFTHEVAKESPAGRMTNTWSLEPRTTKKKKPAKGLDILIVPGTLRGFTQDTWNELPAEDMAPILLPWSDVTSERWTFSGDEATGTVSRK